jgi:hypothetical protein
LIDLLRGRGAEVAAVASAALVIAAGLVLGPSQAAVAEPAQVEEKPAVTQVQPERDEYVAALGSAARAPGLGDVPAPDPGPAGAFRAAVRVMQERGGEPVIRHQAGRVVVADRKGVIASIPLG